MRRSRAIYSACEFATLGLQCWAGSAPPAQRTNPAGARRRTWGAVALAGTCLEQSRNRLKKSEGSVVSAVEIESKAQLVRRAPAARRWWIVAAVLLLIAALLSAKLWFVYQRAQAVRADVRAIQSLAGTPITPAAAAQLGPLLAQARADTAALRAEAGLLLPATRWLGWLPRYGGELAASAPLLDAAAELSAAADDAFQAFGPLLVPADSAPLDGPRLQARLDAAGPQIGQARAALGRAAAAWSQIDLATFQPATAKQLRPIEQALPVARLALEAAPAMPALLDDLQALQPYAGGKPSAEQLAALGPLLGKARHDTAALRVAAAPLLAPGAGQPAPAASLASAAPMIDAVAELAAAADDAYAGLAPLLLARSQGGPLGAAVVDQVLAAQPRLAAARDAATRAADAAARLQASHPPAAIVGRLQPLTTLAALLRDGMNLALALPDLLGAHAPAEYLLLAQNPDELRATGGFITAAGIATFDHGRPSEILLHNSPYFDDFANVAYPDPPAPMLRYMSVEMWTFRDANWSPDFPAAAQQARALFALTQGHEPPAVVAFDPYAAQMLLEVLGPVTVEGNPAPVTAENVLAYLRSEHDNQDDQADKKAYIGRLANAMLAKMNGNGGQIDIWRLALALRRALRERHLLLDVPNPNAQALFERYGWNGAVRPGSGDFVMPIDSNLGYNKMNALVTRSITYALDLSEPSAPQAALTLRHTNPVQSPAACAQQVDGESSYAQWMQRCYYDYMRVLAPRGSQFVGADTRPVPDAAMLSEVGDDGTVHTEAGPAGTSQMSVFQLIGFGETRDTVLRYALPPAIVRRDADGSHYHLSIQKQPGTVAAPFAVELKLPAGARIASASPAPAGKSGQTVRWAGMLDADQAIDVIFTTP